MPSNTKFPHNPYGLSSSYSRSDIQIDGMKVKFDKVADLVPAELTMKDGKAYSAAQSVWAKSFDFDNDTCTIYIVATPAFVAQLEGKVESKSGYVLSIRNYVEDIYRDVNGLKNFQVKLVDSEGVPNFNTLTDTYVHLHHDDECSTSEFCRSSVGVYFFAPHSNVGQAPGTAHSVAYLVAHEALHAYLSRLGAVLWGEQNFLSPHSGGHTNVGPDGNLLPNLNLEGQKFADFTNGPTKYKGLVPSDLTWKKEFKEIHTSQLYFLQRCAQYMNLTHSAFTVPTNQQRLATFRSRQGIVSKSRKSDFNSTLTLGGQIDLSQDPATVPFR